MRDLRPDELNYVSGGDYGQKNTNKNTNKQNTNKQNTNKRTTNRRTTKRYG